MMVLDFLVHLYFELPFLSVFSLRSRRLEVVGEERTGAREGDTRGCLPSRVSFSRASFFLVPTTSKRLLRRLERVYDLHPAIVAILLVKY